MDYEKVNTKNKQDSKNLVKNSLGFDNNLFIYQDKSMFNYSIDTILLGNFVSINSKINKILEVGTNNGALSIFVSERKKDLKIDAIEILDDAIPIAKLNIDLNKKNHQINLIHDDFKKFAKNYQQKYDGIVCNPPFYKIKTNRFKKKSNNFIASTHEINLTIEELCYFSSKIIKQKGYLTIVLPIERMIDAFIAMRKNSFEPKKIQMIFPRVNQKANLVLIEARFKTGYGQFFLPNIYLHPLNKNKHEYLPNVQKKYKPIKWDQNE